MNFSPSSSRRIPERSTAVDATGMSISSRSSWWPTGCSWNYWFIRAWRDTSSSSLSKVLMSTSRERLRKFPSTRKRLWLPTWWVSFKKNLFFQWFEGQKTKKKKRKNVKRHVDFSIGSFFLFLSPHRCVCGLLNRKNRNNSRRVHV